MHKRSARTDLLSLFSLKGRSTMILQEWLDKLKMFDPDDWCDIERLRARFSAQTLQTKVEAEITFRTLGGTVDQVTIQLIGKHDNVLVDLDYKILQLDLVPLMEYIQEAVFPPDEQAGSTS
jgi:hypothetical protein